MHRVHHIRFGSPFQVEENGEEREKDSEAQPLPVILWDAPAVLKCTHITEERAENRERSNLGSVTVWVRGRRMDLDETPTSPIQKELSGTVPNPGRALMPGYSVRAARIIAFVDDNCIVVPMSSPLSDSCDGIHRRSSHEIQEHEPLKLTDWLKLARRESSQKAPLPRDWQSQPLHRLIDLAQERGFKGDQESKMSIVKFLRNWSLAPHGTGPGSVRR